MLLRYLAAFGLTLAVEVPIYVVSLTQAADVRWRRALVAAIGVNVVTHPALWWGLRPFAHHHGYAGAAIAAELLVCVVEWLLLVAWTRRPGRTRVDLLVLAAASLAANAASVLAGLLVLT
jgi:hypothetical protein